ncbi:universal stress protein [Pedobacter sp. MC2016-24]|uniref:universal stress protein n=1 Tax=Pedobacter sp. MC2016-24 TaxID=2780090 RepID=UPI001882CCC5|nr:universal stress protein [Pedobacter sp. MC2016-24]MBE9600252.1 universal stress protein [Pedobacter sp. MC2016-24]
MKKILIPTDFSSSAKNAAHYAMHLAKEMKNDLKLVNAMMIPVEVPVAGHVSASLISFDALEEEVEGELERIAEKMMYLDGFETPEHTFHPFVEYVKGVGPVAEVVNRNAAHADVSLVVMGTADDGKISRFLFGSTTHSVIEGATFPLLFIPSQCRFEGLHKIAFATDLSEADVAIIHVLAGFAKTFNAEILIVHICEKNQRNVVENQLEIDSFLNEVTSKVNYHKIYYHHVLGTDVNDGLDWLAAHGQIQMLVMVHRNHGLLHKVFKGSYTQRMKRRIDIPLFVFPSGYTANPFS